MGDPTRDPRSVFFRNFRSFHFPPHFFVLRRMAPEAESSSFEDLVRAELARLPPSYSSSAAFNALPHVLACVSSVSQEKALRELRQRSLALDDLLNGVVDAHSADLHAAIASHGEILRTFQRVSDELVSMRADVAEAARLADELRGVGGEHGVAADVLAALREGKVAEHEVHLLRKAARAVRLVEACEADANAANCDGDEEELCARARRAIEASEAVDALDELADLLEPLRAVCSARVAATAEAVATLETAQRPRHENDVDDDSLKGGGASTTNASSEGLDVGLLEVCVSASLKAPKGAAAACVARAAAGAHSAAMAAAVPAAPAPAPANLPTKNNEAVSSTKEGSSGATANGPSSPGGSSSLPPPVPFRF